MFAIRIVTVDYYMTAPIIELDPMYSDFRGTEIQQVPVVRIFGSTPAGQKTCLHLHGVFPYIYVPYNSQDLWERYAYQLATSLDKTINMSLGKSHSPTQHVYKITLVDAVPFYGYHSNEKKFLKIHFYNPQIIKKAVEFLQNGAVMNCTFQPHEAHIPFILQMFMDFNLYGMNLVFLSSVKFRRKEIGEENNQYFSTSNQSSILNTPSFVQIWNLRNIPSNLLLPNEIACQSKCELEVDALANDIIIQESLNELCLNPGLKAIWEDEKQRRREQGDASQISCIDSQDRENIHPTESEMYFKEKFSEKVRSLRPLYSTSANKTELANQSLIDDPGDADLPLDPIVNEELALSLISNEVSSQPKSFPNTLDSQDESLVQFLVNIKSQKGEDVDSILSQTILQSEEDDQLDEDRETLEMTQLIWDTDNFNAVAWEQNSQSANVQDGEKDVADYQIPQVDGPGDPKPVKTNNTDSQSSFNQTRRRLTARKSTHRRVFPSRDLDAFVYDYSSSLQQTSSNVPLLFSGNVDNSACAMSNPNSFSQSCMYSNNFVSSVGMKNLGSSSPSCFPTNFVNVEKCHDSYSSTWCHSANCQRDNRSSVSVINPFTDEFFDNPRTVQHTDYMVSGCGEEYSRSNFDSNSDIRECAKSVSLSLPSYNTLHMDSYLMSGTNRSCSQRISQTSLYENSWTLQSFTNAPSAVNVSSALFHPEKQLAIANNQFPCSSSQGLQPFEDLHASTSLNDNPHELKDSLASSVDLKSHVSASNLNTEETCVSQDDSARLRTAVDALIVINDGHLVPCDALTDEMPNTIIEKMTVLTSNSEVIVTSDLKTTTPSVNEYENQVVSQHDLCQQNDNSIVNVEQNSSKHTIDVDVISEKVVEIDSELNIETETQQHSETKIDNAVGLDDFKKLEFKTTSSLKHSKEPKKLDEIFNGHKNIQQCFKSVKPSIDKDELKIFKTITEEPQKRLPVLEKMALLINDASFFPLEKDWVISQIDKNFQQLSLKFSEDENASLASSKLQNRTEIIRNLRLSRLSLKRKHESVERKSVKENSLSKTNCNGSDEDNSKHSQHCKQTSKKLMISSSSKSNSFVSPLLETVESEKPNSSSESYLIQNKLFHQIDRTNEQHLEHINYSTVKPPVKKRCFSLRKKVEYDEFKIKSKSDLLENELQQNNVKLPYYGNSPPKHVSSKEKSSDISPKLLCHSVGTNVHPSDLPRISSRDFYTVKYGTLKVNVPRTVKISHLKKLGWEDLKIKKLNQEMIAAHCNHSNSEVDRVRIQVPVNQKSQLSLTKETEHMLPPEKQIHRKWHLESVSDSLKIRFRAPRTSKFTDNSEENLETSNLPGTENALRKYEIQAVDEILNHSSNNQKTEITPLCETTCDQTLDTVGIAKNRSRRSNVVYKQLPTLTRRNGNFKKHDQNGSTEFNKHRHKTIVPKMSNHASLTLSKCQTECRLSNVSVAGRKPKKRQGAFKDLEICSNENKIDKLNDNTVIPSETSKTLLPPSEQILVCQSPSTPAKPKYPELRVVITPLPKKFIDKKEDDKSIVASPVNSSPQSSDALWNMAFASPQEKKSEKVQHPLSLWSPTQHANDYSNLNLSPQRPSKRPGKLKLWLKKVKKSESFEQRVNDQWSVKNRKLSNKIPLHRDDSMDSDSDHAASLLHRNIDISEIDNCDSDVSVGSNSCAVEMQGCSTKIDSRTSTVEKSCDDVGLNRIIKFELDELSDISLLSETDEEEKGLIREDSRCTDIYSEDEMEDMKESLILSDFSDEEFCSVLKQNSNEVVASQEKLKAEETPNLSPHQDHQLSKSYDFDAGNIVIEKQDVKTMLKENPIALTKNVANVSDTETQSNSESENPNVTMVGGSLNTEEIQHVASSSIQISQDLLSNSLSLFSNNTLDKWEDISSDENETLSDKQQGESIISVYSSQNESQEEDALQIQPMEYSESLVKLLRKDNQEEIFTTEDNGEKFEVDKEVCCQSVKSDLDKCRIVTNDDELKQTQNSCTPQALEDKVSDKDKPKGFQLIASKEEVLKRATDKVTEELASMTNCQNNLIEMFESSNWNISEPGKRMFLDVDSANSLNINERSKGGGITNEETQEAVNSLLNIINSDNDDSTVPMSDLHTCDNLPHAEEADVATVNVCATTSAKQKILTLKQLPPTRAEIVKTNIDFGIFDILYQDAYCSNAKDIPEKITIAASHKLRHASKLLQDLQDFKGKFQFSGIETWQLVLATHYGSRLNSSNPETLLQMKKTPETRAILASNKHGVVLTPAAEPPTRKNISEWIKTHLNKTKVKKTRKHQPQDNSLGNVSVKQYFEEMNSVKVRLKQTMVEKNRSISGARKRLLSVFEESAQNNSNLGTYSENLKSPLLNLISHIEDRKTPPFHSTPMSSSVKKCTSPICTPLCRKSLESKATSKHKRKRLNMLGNDIVNSWIPEDTSLTSPMHDCINNSVTSVPSSNSSIPLQSSFQSLHKSNLHNVTGGNSCGFKLSYQNLMDAKISHQHQYLTTFVMEVHVAARGDLRPDPEFDPVLAVFYHIHTDVPPDASSKSSTITGVYIVDSQVVHRSSICDSCKGVLKNECDYKEPGYHGAEMINTCNTNCQYWKQKRTLTAKTGITDLNVVMVESENELFHQFIHLVQRIDPDILTGYEVQMLSWGYMKERAEFLHIGFHSALSRISENNTCTHQQDDDEDSDYNSFSQDHFTGRILLNLWRLMRHEASLTSYSFENVFFHILHKRIPCFSFKTLTEWFSGEVNDQRWQVIVHYLTRVKGIMDLIMHVDLIGRTSELARLFGIQFFEVLSRGSQFRVESMMLRLAHNFNYVAVSPSIQQRSCMRAPESIALVMEPESKFYSNPVLVLDFQSLYPSIVIAYNYCFSTCLGRVEHLGVNESFEFGCTSLNIPSDQLKNLSENTTFSPTGVAFVKSSVRRGVLPTMLQEILNTRIMVKKSMKNCQNNKPLHRILDARQLGLKLIANVTYGYTAANFSGRMPCAEIADSIVSKARETLERAISLVTNRTEWNANVVYGDTDSLFVHLPGRSKEAAFRIGQEIADAVTADNPKPVKLKFEKVYLPCVLQTKKRYVGYMYETPDQKDPVFNAKGIETIRRDGCPALSKTLEKSLKILFKTRDLSQVKIFVQKQFQKFLMGDVSIQDCIFAREYRGRSGYKPGACVPALEIAKRLTRKDRRAEPRCGERVPFVIVYGSPGEPLFHLVRQPEDVLLDSTMRINAHYYVNNVLTSPLQRMFGLMGINVNTWYQTLPKTSIPQLHSVVNNSALRKGNIPQYFNSCDCPVCLKPTQRGGLCTDCHANPQKTMIVINQQANAAENCYHRLKQICSACSGVNEPNLMCVSLDCPNLYRLVERANNLQQTLHLRKSCHSFSINF